MTHSSQGCLRQHLKGTILLAFPLVGSNLAQIATQLTDTIMLGWYGVEELAASVLAGTMFIVLFLLSSGFALGVVPLAAKAQGEGDLFQVRRVVRMGLWLSMFSATAALVPMWFATPILIAFGQESVTAIGAGTYLRIALWGMYPALMVMLLKGFFTSAVRPQIVLWATISAALLNLVADYVLIFGRFGFPELGLEGAALASVATQTLAAAIMVGFIQFDSALRAFEVFKRIWVPDWPALRHVFRIGLPIGATLVAETGMFGAAAIMVGWLGTEVLAAHGIALQVAAFTFMAYLGIANASTALIGRAAGRQDLSGVRRAAQAAIIWTAIFVTVALVVMLTFPRTLVMAFLDPATPVDAPVVLLGITLLTVAALFQAGDAFQVIGLSLLRGLADTRLPLIIAVFSYWVVGLPAGYVLGFTLGLESPGIWGGLAIGLMTAAVLFFWRFYMLLARMEYQPAT